MDVKSLFQISSINLLITNQKFPQYLGCRYNYFINLAFRTTTKNCIFLYGNGTYALHQHVTMKEEITG